MHRQANSQTAQRRANCNLRWGQPTKLDCMVDSGHIRPWQSVAQISRNRLLVYLYLLHNETQQNRPHRLAHVIGGIVQNVASALIMQTE